MICACSEAAEGCKVDVIYSQQVPNALEAHASQCPQNRMPACPMDVQGNRPHLLAFIGIKLTL